VVTLPAVTARSGASAQPTLRATRCSGRETPGMQCARATLPEGLKREIVWPTAFFTTGRDEPTWCGRGGAAGKPYDGHTGIGYARFLPQSTQRKVGEIVVGLKRRIETQSPIPSAGCRSALHHCVSWRASLMSGA
jgi:hypothetical protein